MSLWPGWEPVVPEVIANRVFEEAAKRDAIPADDRHPSLDAWILVPLQFLGADDLYKVLVPAFQVCQIIKMWKEGDWVNVFAHATTEQDDAIRAHCGRPYT